MGHRYPRGEVLKRGRFLLENAPKSCSSRSWTAGVRRWRRGSGGYSADAALMQGWACRLHHSIVIRCRRCCAWRSNNHDEFVSAGRPRRSHVCWGGLQPRLSSSSAAHLGRDCRRQWSTVKSLKWQSSKKPRIAEPPRAAVYQAMRSKSTSPPNRPSRGGGASRKRYDDIETQRVVLLDRLGRMGEQAPVPPGYKNALVLLNQKFRVARIKQRIKILEAAEWLITVIEMGGGKR